MKDKIREILVKHSDNKKANDRIEAELLDLFSVILPFPTQCCWGGNNNNTFGVCSVCGGMNKDNGI